MKEVIISILGKFTFQDYPLNPKALSLGELYGEFDLNTNEWTDGVLSSVMRQTCAGKYTSQHSISSRSFFVCLYPEWIEISCYIMSKYTMYYTNFHERISPIILLCDILLFKTQLCGCRFFFKEYKNSNHFNLIFKFLPKNIFLRNKTLQGRKKNTRDGTLITLMNR